MDSNDLANRLFHNATGTLEMYSIYLGERLGYYRALASSGPMTPYELAASTGTSERYTREWLDQQAATGLLEVDEGRYSLPAEHIPVLADRDHVLYGTQSSIELVRVARRLADVADAYKTGGAPPSLPWEPEGRAEGNRAKFLNLLGKEWLPSIPSVHATLSGPARVADIACGLGWSSIAMALAYPQITVDALDLDERAIVAARENAEQYGVADRVRFTAADAAKLSDTDPYDVVMIIEALHDMSYPVAGLQAARKLLSDNGSVVVVDTRTDEEPTTPASLREQYEYGWSVISCLPDAMGVPDSAATGTVMRPATLQKYAHEAGFQSVEILPVDSEVWQFYLLRD